MDELIEFILSFVPNLEIDSDENYYTLKSKPAKRDTQKRLIAVNKLATHQFTLQIMRHSRTAVMSLQNVSAFY